MSSTVYHSTRANPIANAPVKDPVVVACTMSCYKLTGTTHTLYTTQDFSRYDNVKLVGYGDEVFAVTATTTCPGPFGIFQVQEVIVNAPCQLKDGSLIGKTSGVPYASKDGVTWYALETSYTLVGQLSIDSAGCSAGNISVQLDWGSANKYWTGVSGFCQVILALRTDNCLESGESECRWRFDFGSIIGPKKSVGAAPIGDYTIHDCNGLPNMATGTIS